MQEFAESIGYGRHMVTKWTKGERWQDRLEPLFEQKLSLPSGYFAKIGAGFSHEEALSPVQLRDPNSITREQFNEIMGRNDEEAEAWKDHLRRQVALIFRTLKLQ